mmetsp:Transcript_7185/g.18741  ORF Transcript_7185/g.18741 Transcript_7185/m.18741 type:complete len:299 (+) Transcript_7185:1811-2707(+)
MEAVEVRMAQSLGSGDAFHRLQPQHLAQQIATVGAEHRQVSLELRFARRLQVLDHDVHSRVAVAARHLSEASAERPQVVGGAISLVLVVGMELGRGAAWSDGQLLIAERGKRRRETEITELEEVLVLGRVERLCEHTVRREVTVCDAAGMRPRKRREQLIEEGTQHDGRQRTTDDRVRRTLKRSIHDLLYGRVDELHACMDRRVVTLFTGVESAGELQSCDARVVHALEAAHPAHNVVRDSLVIALAHEHDADIATGRAHGVPLILLALLSAGGALCPHIPARVFGLGTEDRPVDVVT